MRTTRDSSLRQVLGRGVGLLLVALAAMVLIVGLLATRARTTLEDLRRVERIDSVLPRLSLVLQDLTNAETGQRGYLLTQRASYLQPYRDAARTLERRLDELMALELDTLHRPRLQRANELARLKMSELAQTLRLHDAGRHEEALELLLSDQGQRHMNEVRDTLGEVIADLRAERSTIGERLSAEAGRTELLLLAALAVLTLFTVLAMTQVVTRTRQAERMQHRLSGIADNVPVLISQFDRQGRLVFANAEIGRVFKVDPATLVGRTVEEMRGSDDAELLRPHMARVLAGEAVEFDTQQLVDGQTIHFHQRYVPDRIDGQVRGFYAVSIDVTEQARAQRLVAASERRMKAVTDNVPVLIAYFDHALRLRYANETLRSWLGLDPQTSIGMTAEEMLGPALYEQRRQQLALALTGERVEYELDSQMMGHLRHLQIRYLPDIGGDGAVLGLYLLCIDITVLKQAEAQLAQLASSDALTGLPNRREFDQALLQALARQRRRAHDGGVMALLYLDIDRFKSINDSHGHGVGDAVLREFAQCLRRTVRGSDIVARIAGDEFIAVVEGLKSPEEAEQVARKLVDSVRVTPMAGLAVTTSVGVAAVAAGDAQAQDLIALADRALYRAKAHGRDSYAVMRWPVGERRA